MSNAEFHNTEEEAARQMTTSSPIPSTSSDSQLSESEALSKDSSPGPVGPTEILPPTQARLRTGRGIPTSRPFQVMAALTTQALWIQEVWKLRRVMLSEVSAIVLKGDKSTIFLTIGPDSSVENIELTFSVPGLGERWATELQERVKSASPDSIDNESCPPEGVTLVRGRAEVPHEVLGELTCSDQSTRLAAWGLRLRAGMMGADAVIGAVSRKCPDLGAGGCEISGFAVRVGDHDALKRLRFRSYRQEASTLFTRSFALISIQVIGLSLASLIWSNRGGGLEVPSGESRSQVLESLGYGMALLFAWPFFLLVLFRISLWTRLLRSIGLTILAATTVRGLMVIVAHLLAVATTGANLANSKLWFLIDPTDWAFIIAGGLLCARAWRLSNETRQILPPELQIVSPASKAWSRGALVVSCAYVLFVICLAGWYRYEASVYLLQPGIDVKREQEALTALNEGVEQSKKGDLVSAERSFRRSLKIWEELTASPPVPAIYRRNMAITIANLGGIRQRQGHPEEAKEFYNRCLTIAKQLDGDPFADNEFKLYMAEIRQLMGEFRNQSADELDVKDQAAARKYEEAQVKAGKGDVAAERLYQECISEWETIFPQATNEEYRRSAVVRFATAYLMLGEFQKALGKRAEAEASLQKAVEHGERAVSQSTDRPLLKHNLDLARRYLVIVREQAHQEELNKLCVEERFAEAAELLRRGLADAENQARMAKDRELAAGVLAYRLDRFAWFLGHNASFRDTKAAVGYARRATELQPNSGDYWYTLGMVQYRNGDWREGLASLEKLRAIEGGNDGSVWILIAMNQHRLGQREEALAALRNADEWMRKRRQEVEKDAVLLSNFELARPAIEALRREAVNLIDGKQRTID